MLNPQTRTQQQWLVLVCALLMFDALCVAGSLTLAYFVRIDGVLPYYSETNNAAYRSLVAAALPIFIICFALLGLYKEDNLLGGMVEYKQVLKGCTVGVGLLVVYTVFVRLNGFDVSRGWLIFSWLFSVALVGLMRFLVRRIVYRVREAGYLTARVLIIGANDQGAAIAAQWRSTPASGMHIVGFLDDFKPVGTQVAPGLKVLGRPSAIDALCRKHDVDEVVVVSSAVAWESFGEIVTDVGADKRYTLRLSPGFYELLTTGVAVTNKTFVPLLTINENRIVGVDAVLKTVLDFGLGALIALVSLPFALVIASILKLRRPGSPVLTRNQAIGRNGQTFDMIRFDSVSIVSTGTGSNGEHNFENWLHITGLNHLPELINVFQGDMSLVGPQPRADHNEVTDMHTMHNLQAVKPGIVGPWVRRDHLQSSDLVHDELSYVRNWTIWADLPILFQTATTLFSRIMGIHTPTSTSTTAQVGQQSQTVRREHNFQEDVLI